MKTIKPSLILNFGGLIVLAMSAQATVRTWNGAGTNNNWTTVTNWVGNTAPAANNDSLVFDGVTRQNNTNNYSAITNVGLTFSTGGWTLNGNLITQSAGITNTLGTNVINNGIALTASRNVHVVADQLTVNGVVSQTAAGFGLTKSGVGTLVLTASNTFSGPSTINASAGIVRITNPLGLGTGPISIPKAGAVLSGYLQLNLTGSNVVNNAFTNLSSTTTLGDQTVPTIENLSGTNTITSGLVVATAGGNGLSVKASGGLLTLAGNIGALQTSRGIELNGSGNGVVAGAITNGSAGSAFTIWKDGTGTWTLNGTNTTPGTMIIQNGKIALGASGSISNVPNIIINSGGTLDVSAVPGTWLLASGKTIQGSGTVVGNVATASAASTTITPGTVPALYSTRASTTAGTLTFSNNLALNGATLAMNLSSDPTGTIRPNDVVKVVGNLTAAGTNTISLGANPESVIVNGTYPLIKFNGTFTGDPSNFTVVNFPSGGRGAVGGYVTTNIASIDLVVTGTPPASLVWRGDGAANNWDITTTSNWFNSGNPDVYYNNDTVLFDNTSSNFSVNIPADVSPGYVVVDSTNNYSISGGGAITGANGLTKRGTGKLTINNNNLYTGVTTYGGGTISVSLLASNGPLGAASSSLVNQYFNGGTLEFTGPSETCARGFSIGPNGGTLAVTDPAATVTFSTSGSWNANGNAFTKTGSGTVFWSNQQVLDGTNYILGGILKIPTVGLFGVNLTTPVFINGGALDINSFTMDAKPVVVAGMGDLNITPGVTNGVIVNNSATGQNNALRFVTLTGDTAFGGVGRWDIRANSTASLSTGGNPYNLIKVGANQISLVGVTVDPALANIDVRSGTFSYETGTTGLGNPLNTLSIRSGATFQMFSSVNPLNKQVALDDGSTLSAASGSANTISGPVSLTGDTFAGPTINVTSGVTLGIGGIVSGAGNLNKTGAGTLNLTGTNTYTGTTTVTAGKLTVKSAQTGAGAITVNDGSTFGVTVSGSSQLKTDTLILGNSVGPTTNEFSGIISTTTAPLRGTNLLVNGPVTINVVSGSFLAGQIYPLISYDSISGAGSFAVGTLPPLVSATVVTNGNSIALNVTAAVAIETWTGIVNDLWNIGTTTNWTFNGAAATFVNGNTVLFDDTAASNTTVIIAAPVSPSAMIVNNSAKTYAFSGSAISGTNSLTKQGTGALTLSSGSTFSGGTTLSEGTLNLNHNNALGTGALVVAGGAIDNTSSGPVTVTNTQAWNGDFAYNGNQDLIFDLGAVTVSSNRQITANGVGVLTVASIVGDGGSGFILTKGGSGAITLAGTNTYTGGTVVTAGTLTLQGNQTGANGGLVLSPNTSGATVNIAAGANLTVVSNKVIQVGNTSPVGSLAMNLNVAGVVTNKGALRANRFATVNLTNGATWLQTGNMEVHGLGGSGFSPILTVGTNTLFTYAGTNAINLSGAEGDSGQGLINVRGMFVTSSGFEQTTTPTTGFGRLTLLGGGTLKLSGDVPALTTNGVQFNVGAGGGTVDTAGFNTAIGAAIAGSGTLTKAGAGVLTLEGLNTYTNATFITGGTLSLSPTAVLISSGVVVAGGATFDVSAQTAPTFALVSGQFLANSTSTGNVTGSVDAVAGSLALTYAASTPSLSIANGALNLDAATPVTVNNTGAALGNGSYKLVAAGSGGSVTGTAPTSVTVTGNGLGAGGTASLNITGSELFLNVTGATTVNTTPTNIVSSVSGGNLDLSWPSDHIGWRLLVQTNSRSIGLVPATNAWFTWPGSDTTNVVSITVNPANPTVFFRLVYP